MPTPERYAVPMTLPLASNTTTAPSRRPGYIGLKITDTVSVPLGAVQLVAPATAVNSEPEFNPVVTTCTALAVVDGASVTLTHCESEEEATFVPGNVTACASAPAAAPSNTAATAS